MSYSLPLFGGILIGLSAVVMLLFVGRITGISSIIWSSLAEAGSSAWRWAFLVGLIAGPLAFHALSGQPAPAPNPSPWWLAAIAGLLVGFGTRLGGGCTSGHGVCGLGRLSMRSLIATLTFMTTGIATVYVLRHVLGGAA
jgi:uncharacterized membrane protein YedE/YeeE